MSKAAKKIAIAIWNDRHADTTAHPFTSAAKAIKWAREQARKFDRRGDFKEVELNDAMLKSGWVYAVYYSCEGDGLRVVMAEMDKAD